MKRVLNTNEEIISATLKALEENGRWMTANEIINYAHSKGIMEAKDAPRQAEAHPIYRILTSMMRSEENKVNGLERRIRESGPEKGSYEYAYKGLYDGTRVLVNGVAMKPATGEKVVIGDKTYSKAWLEAHPDKWKSLEEEAAKPKPKSILDLALESMVFGK